MASYSAQPRPEKSLYNGKRTKHGKELLSDDDERDDDSDNDHDMTAEEKKAIYKAAEDGNIDDLEELLNRTQCGINMLRFNENLLMTAIRAGKQDIAEFLIDNGIDYNYETKIFDFGDNHRSKMNWFSLSCRQMAYDKDMLDIVELIDDKNGELFKFVKPRDRTPRLMRPKHTSTPNLYNGDSVDSCFSEAEKYVERDSGYSRDNDADSGHHSDIMQQSSCSDPGDCKKDDVCQSTTRSGASYGQVNGQREPGSNDEGYSSPKSSRQSSPATKTDARGRVSPPARPRSNKAAIVTKRENTKYASDLSSNLKMTKKEINAVGSYARESKLWVSTVSTKLSTKPMDEEERIPANVRTQSPWHDDRPTNTKRNQRRLPATPTSGHKPRIMSPPSEANPRVSKMLLQTNIVTLPNKMSFPSLPNNDLCSPRDYSRTSTHSLSSQRRMPFGRSMTALRDTLPGNNRNKKYEEHYVDNMINPRNRRGGMRS